MMKARFFKLLLTLILLGSTQSAFSYENDEKNETCKKPRFTNFTLSEYKVPEKLEVAPESEFSFAVSVWAIPETLTLMVKNKPLPFTLENTSTFHRVKAKLPSEITGQFIRLQVGVKAILGCSEHSGWLIKVADKPKDVVN